MSSLTATMTPAVPLWRRRAWNLFLWVLQVAFAALFLSAGADKLAGEAAMVQAFDAIGFGQWFRYLTGGLEVVGGVLLLLPALAGAGALLLGAVMVGAILTHLVLIGGSALPAAVFLLALAPIAIGRWERTLELVRRFRS